MIRTAIFDFDGVLSFDCFYQSALSPEQSDIAHWIAKNIFEKDRELVRKWMRGQISSLQINEKIAEGTGADLNLLNQTLTKSVELMKLDEDLLMFIVEIRRQGIKVGLVTDNMDVFSDITVSNHRLDQKFDVVLNSADYGFLKKEQNGKLLDIALEKLGEKDISKSLFADNQQEIIELYKQKGGRGYVYKSFKKFEKWAHENLKLEPVPQF